MAPIHPILYALLLALSFCSFVLLITVIMSLLLQFKIINHHNPMVYKIYSILEKMTEPVLRRIRKYVPPIGGIDISPIIAFFMIEVLEYTIRYYGTAV